MDSHSSPEILLTHFDWNIQRLKEMLNQEPSDYFRSASLQRFGLTCELAIKCLQGFAQENGETCDGLEECVQMAAKSEWVCLDDTWKDLISAYDQISLGEKGGQVELEIFQNLGNYYNSFKNLHTILLKRV